MAPKNLNLVKIHRNIGDKEPPHKQTNREMGAEDPKQKKVHREISGEGAEEPKNTYGAEGAEESTHIL